MDVLELIDKLDDLIHNAKAVPLTDQVRIDREAIYELLDEMRATPNTEDFAKALENGAVLLWVRADAAERQAKAQEVLSRHGAADLHIHSRPVD